MKFKIELVKLLGSEIIFVDALDSTLAEDFAEDQRRSYGCERAITTFAPASDIPKEAEVLYLGDTAAADAVAAYAAKAADADAEAEAAKNNEGQKDDH